MRVMGDMLDFAVHTLGMDGSHFFELFLSSAVCRQFEKGNPKYVVGMNGPEVAREVLRDVGFPDPDQEDVMYLDKSPEYWCGWALAYYQWYTAKAFADILRAVPIVDILGMYPTFHEADLSRFVDAMEEKTEQFYQETKLKRMRLYAGLSQHELARLSGVSVRQIQLFEQRQRDINKTQAVNLVKLSRTIGCGMEDLMEI